MTVNSQTSNAVSTVHHNEGDIFGHPKGLFILFFTEMWERMSYYGMRALLVLYMMDHLFSPEVAPTVLGFSTIKNILESIFGPLAAQPLSSQIYGLYTGLVYFTPLFGGIIADRYWGQKKTVVVGGVLMIIGHFLMASESLFFVALFFLIIGNGAFKPNVSTQVGDLYAPGDSRRDGSFIIFYQGINLGALLAPLICGTLGQKVGWHYGFGAAGVGMAIGLVVYLLGQKHLQPHPENVKRNFDKNAKTEKVPFTAGEKKAIWALVILCALNVIFWGVYEQQGNTMQIFADKNIDWVFFGWEMPSSWFQSMNPFFIIFFAPFLVKFWQWQAKRGKEPSSVTKMAMGCALLAAAFGIMILAAMSVGESRGTVLWLVVTTFILTVGELYLSPVGLSLVTKVAPARIVSMMMGMWFLSSFFGNYMSGFLGTFYSSMSRESFFGMMAILSVVAAVLMAAFNKPLRSALGKH